MSERPEPSYTGDERFFFVSYGHDDSDLVYREMRWLQEAGFNLWHDEGIHVGSVWRKAIADALTAAAGLLFIATKSSVASDHCLKELSFVLDEGKPVFVVQLDDTKLPGLLRLSLADRQMLNRAEFDEKTYRAKLIQALSTVAKPGGRAHAAAAAAPPLPLPTKPSIAVMPFANLSGDAEQDYFADGMVVEIVEALSRIRSIFVIASGSSLSFKGKGVSAQDAARQLGVRYVLEGSMRKAGGRVRIGVQLIDAADGAQIWTHRFEDTLEDVFALQDRVALAVAGKIEPTVQQAEIRRASARPTDNLSSYDLYLRALPLRSTFVRADMLEALDLASRAITLDADFGPALALAANCHRIIVLNRWSDDLEGHRRLSLELAHRALKAAGDDAAVIASVASSVDFLEGDHEAAVALLERALTLNPGCASAWMWSGIRRVRAGETDAAIENLRTALRLDPLGPGQPATTGFIGRALFQEGRFSEAVPLLKEHAQHVDAAPMPQAFLAAAYGHLAQASEAQAALARYRALSSQPLEDFAANWLRDPAQRKLFLDGIAMAEGRGPAYVPTDVAR